MRVLWMNPKIYGEGCWGEGAALSPLFAWLHDLMQTEANFAARGGRNQTLCAASAVILVSAAPGRSHRKRLLRERGFNPPSLLLAPGG